MRYRHLRRTAIAALAAVAFVLVVAALALAFLSSSLVRRRAVLVLEGQAARLGLHLDVGELRWGLLPPQVILDGVRLEGPGLRAEARRVQLGLARVRLAARTVELDTLAAEGVRLRFEKLPTQGGGGRSWAHLVVRHLELRDLEVEGGGLPGGLTLALAGVDGAWAVSDGGPRGLVRVHSARLVVPGLEPISFQLQARFAVNDGLDVPRLRLLGPGIDLEGHGEVTRAGVVRLAARGGVDLAQLDRMVKAGGSLAGRCSVDASLATDREELLLVRARADRLSAAGFPLEQLEGQLALRRDGLTGTVERARFCGGTLTGSYRLGRLGAPFPHHAQAHVQGLDLAAFLHLLGVPPAGLAGRAHADAELEWEGLRIKAGAGHGTAVVEPTGNGLPVGGNLAVTLTPDGLLHFAAADLRLGSSNVAWEGPLTLGDWQPAWSVHASPAELAEVIPLVNAWVGSQVLPAEIGGSGDLEVTLAGPWRDLRVGVRLDAHPLLYSAVHLDRVVAEGIIQGSALRLGHSLYQIADGGGSVSGRIAWGAEAGQDQLALSIDGQHVPLSQVASWVGVESGWSGLASFTGSLRGPLDSARGSWALGLEGIEIEGLSLGDGAAQVALADATFTARGLSFARGLEGSLWWAVHREEVGGDLSWPHVPDDAIPDPFRRLLGAGATVRARFDWPLAGVPNGVLEVRSDSSELRVEAEPDVVTASAELAGRATATVAAERRPDGSLKGRGELELQSAKALLEGVLAQARVPLEGTGSARFDLDWTPGQWPHLDGSITRLDLSLDGRPVRLLEPAPFELSGEGLRLAGVRLGLLGDQVFLRGTVGADGSLSGNLAGTIDALLLRFLIPDWEPAGRATGIVELVGTVGHPGFDGIAQMEQVSFRLPGSQAVVAGVNGTILLSPDELVLDQVGFRALGGSGLCRGRIGLGPGTVELRLDGTATGVEVPLLPGLTPRLGGSFRLEGKPGDLELAGDLTVERAALKRKDDLATILVDWMSTPTTPATEGDLRLDLHLKADRTLEAHTPFVRLVGSAALDVTGTVTRPGVVGRVEFEQGGELTFLGVRYELEHGSISFSDPLRVEPYLDFETRALVQTYQITVRLTGTTDRLVPALSSDPPLPEAEIWSLLALGHREETIGGGAVGVGLASTVLTRQLNAELERRARYLLAVDQVRVDPFAESSTGNPTARITVVKQVSPNWTVILQSNLSGNRQEAVVSRWFLGPSLFVEATRDLDGTLAIDLNVRRRY